MNIYLVLMPRARKVSHAAWGQRIKKEELWEDQPPGQPFFIDKGFTYTCDASRAVSFKSVETAIEVMAILSKKYPRHPPHILIDNPEHPYKERIEQYWIPEAKDNKIVERPDLQPEIK